ncbi:MAG: hypothetical protein LBQ44_10235 [Treponema sp.]|nr:hypothetical protein [Treponema sp.]
MLKAALVKLSPSSRGETGVTTTFHDAGGEGVLPAPPANGRREALPGGRLKAVHYRVNV